MIENLQDKVAVITGGASGIGLEVARLCAAEGMKLVLADIEDGALETVSAEFESQNVPVLGVKCDVSKLEDVQNLADQTMEAFGGVHFLFNNAGVGAGSTIWGSTIADWDWTLGVNLYGVIHGVKVFTPLMLAQEEPCHIVNTASIAGLIAGPSLGPYRVAKHAVVALSETLYFELSQNKTQVGVSVLCPAWTKTKINESARNRPDRSGDAKGHYANGNENPLLASQLQHAVDAVNNGLSPVVVAEAVMDAIREDRFYILTHPKFTKAVAIRMNDIVSGNNPTNLFLPREK